MRARSANCLLVTIFTAFCMTPAVGAPIDSIALPQVPPGAQVISGFEVKRNAYSSPGGSLLWMTENNVFDLKDGIALAGVDPGKTYSEVMLVSFAPPGEGLIEHLLLITGSFDTRHIFRAAELNGAKLLKYLDEPVLAVEPFAREKPDMPETRWLAILGNRIVVFGTPWMVRQALFRFENRAPADPTLLGRLALFRRDVDCWNLVIPVPDTQQPVFLDPDGPWSALFSDSELLMVGVHADSTFRVDLLFQINDKSRNVDLSEKAAQFSRIFFRDAAHSQDSRRRLRNLEIKTTRLRASILLPAKDFIIWKTDLRDRDKELLNIARQRARRAASANPSEHNETITASR